VTGPGLSKTAHSRESKRLVHGWERNLRDRRVAMGDGLLTARIGSLIQSSIPIEDRRGVVANPWPGTFSGSHLDRSAAQSRPVRVGRDLRGLPADDQQGHLDGHPQLPRAPARFVPVAEELVPGRQYIVDGTLLPRWSWATHQRPHSGKHRIAGMNVQVVCPLDSELVGLSDPIEGLTTTYSARTGPAPCRCSIPGPDRRQRPRRPGREHTQQHPCSHRACHRPVEDWTIRRTDHRRLIDTYAATVSAAVGLLFRSLA
jgi:hypothetical protein